MKLIKLDVFSGVFVVFVNSCAGIKKCPDVTGFNPVVDKSTCHVRTRNTFFADQLSPEIKEKIKLGQSIEFIWVPTMQKGPSVVPAHFEVKTVLGSEL